ncbi:MAG: glycoside hydrolase family 2 protein [Terriglobia bacterium]
MAVGIIFFLLLCGVANLPAATRIDLNGDWQFKTDPSHQGEQQGWARAVPAGTDTVRVPHTWNVGKYEDFEGTGWYFKTFDIPWDLRLKHVELHFGATFYRSRVWLNGKQVGVHEGGHTEYFFEVTPLLGQINFLAVEINNQPTLQSIPGWAMKLYDGRNIWYDWWHYGGIVRDVWLTVNESVLIRRQQIRVKVEGATANVTDSVFVENSGKKALAAKLVLKAYPPEGGSPTATAEQALNLTPGAQKATLDLRINSVKLWHFDEPNVYRMQVELVDSKGNPLDSLTDNFGARTIEIRDRKLYLNGEPVRLTGMARHEESPAEGLAETPGTMRYDYDDMKNLQMTLTRPVHYPQNPFILDYCDRNGILLIPEIPMWQFSEKQMSDPKVIELAKQMMRELIEQDYNHPSVFAWSTCNESATDTPGGKAYFKTMYDFIKQLDPDRFVTYADDRIAYVDDPSTNSASLADFIMWNQYFGTWHGPESLLPAAMERIRKNYPNKMVIVSEFGAAGPHARDAVASDKLRVRIIKHQMELFGKQDWISGALLWCYQDYRSHRNLWPGERQGYVDHGLVDENRQRRPSYKTWQKANEPARVMVEWEFNAERRPIGFRASIARRGPDEIPSYTLHNYLADWELRDDDDTLVASGSKTLPEIGPPQTLAADWPAVNSKSLRLRIRLYRPTGFVAVDKSLDWWFANPGGLNIDQMKREGMQVPE